MIFLTVYGIISSLSPFTLFKQLCNSYYAYTYRLINDIIKHHHFNCFSNRCLYFLPSLILTSTFNSLNSYTFLFMLAYLEGYSKAFVRVVIDYVSIVQNILMSFYDQIIKIYYKVVCRIHKVLQLSSSKRGKQFYLMKHFLCFCVFCIPPCIYKIQNRVSEFEDDENTMRRRMLL